MIWLLIAYLAPGAMMLWKFAPGSYINLQRKFGEVHSGKFILTQLVAMISWPVIVWLVLRGR